jgi:hypothetical protein
VRERGLRASGRGSAREKPVRWSSRGMRGGRLNDELIVLPRGGLEHIPKMSDFYLAQVGHVFTEGVCFDTSYALLGSRSVLDSRRPGHCGRTVPVGPPLALALAAIPPSHSGSSG